MREEKILKNIFLIADVLRFLSSMPSLLFVRRILVIFFFLVWSRVLFPEMPNRSHFQRTELSFEFIFSFHNSQSSGDSTDNKELSWMFETRDLSTYLFASLNDLCFYIGKYFYIASINFRGDLCFIIANNYLTHFQCDFAWFSMT